MAFPIGVLIGAGAGIFSALSAKKGQEDANAAQMEFNALEAQKQRDWEERMFGSRYQMTRKDLEAAGYNPLIAVTGSPTVPSGAAAHAEPKSTRSEMSAILANTAKQVSDISLNQSMRDKVVAETQSAKAMARMAEQEAEIATSPWGKNLAKWNYILEKSGISKALQIGGFVTGAGSAARVLRGAQVVSSVRRFRG